MSTFPTTRQVLAVALSAAVAAACSSAANTGFQTGGQAGDSGTPVGTPSGAAADGGGSTDDAGTAIGSSMGASSGASSTDTDATTPPTSGPTGPTGPTTGSTATPDAGGSTGTSTSPPTGVGVDGGCTQNLACTLAVPASTGDIRQDCVNRVNQFRTQCACMKPLARWTDGEACADMDAKYDGMMMSGHAGALGGVQCNWGQAQDECPGYPSNQTVVDQCIQGMWTEGPPPAGTSVAACEQPSASGQENPCYMAHGHFINMTNPAVTKIACGFYTTPAGAIWAAQNLSQ